MSAPKPTDSSKPVWPAMAKGGDGQRSAALGLVLSLMLHAAALLLAGGAILYYAPIPKETFEAADAGWLDEMPVMEEVEDTTLQEPQLPDAVSEQPSESAAATPESVVDSREIILATGASPSLPMMNTAPTVSLTPLAGAGLQQKESGAGNPIGKQYRPMKSLFGDPLAKSNEAFVGYLYDLKQTAAGNPSEMAGPVDEKMDVRSKDNHAYDAVLRGFISNWNPQVLEKYFRSPKSLAAYQIFIPAMDAGEAPKAFDVEKQVAPRRWAIHYRGSFVAPKTMDFRFVGRADDIMVVRFNRKVVLDASLVDLARSANLKENPRSSALDAHASEWISVREGENCAMEILLGERPGGSFYAYLLLQEKDVAYPPHPGGKGWVLPVFQTAPTRIPEYKVGGYNPTVAKQGLVFNNVEK